MRSTSSLKRGAPHEWRALEKALEKGIRDAVRAAPEKVSSKLATVKLHVTALAGGHSFSVQVWEGADEL